MKPLQLKMSAFGSYADETILDFSKLGSNGLYLITGETGSGKTTIFDAISYALFGKASGNARNSYKILRSDYAEGRTKTYVELDFLSGGATYQIRREIIPHFARKTEEVSYTDNVSLTLPDGTVLDRSREVDGKILEVVGLDRDQFAQIVMIAQNDFLRFLQSGTEERVKILRRIFNTSALKAFQEGLKLRAKAKEDARRLLIRDFEKYGVDHNNAKQQFAQWEQEIQADSAAIVSSDKKIQETEHAKEELAATIAVAEGLFKSFEALALQQAALDAHAAKADEMHALAQRKERGQTALRNVKPLADKYAEAEAAYTTARTDFEHAKSDVDAAALAFQQAECTIAELLPLAHVQAEFDALKQQWLEASNRLEALTSLDSNEKAIAEQQSLLAAANADLAETNAFILSLPSVDESKEALDQLAQELAQTRGKQTVLTTLQDEYRIIVDKQRVLSTLQEEFHALLETMKKLPPLDEIRQQFEQLSAKAEKAKEKLRLLRILQSDQRTIAQKQEILEAEQAELVRRNNIYSHAKSNYDTLHEQFILGQAGILAGTLCDGKPCPVCGSSHHPAPAHAPCGEMSSDTLKKLLSDTESAKDKVDHKSSQCAALISEIDLLKNQFHTALAAHIPNGNYDNVGMRFLKELSTAEIHAQELAEKKCTDERFLHKLVSQTEVAVKRQAELSPKNAALLSEITTRKDKLLKDVTAYLPHTDWDNLGTELSDLLQNTKTTVLEMASKKSLHDAAFFKLKKNWELSVSKQQKLDATCVALTTSVSTLTDRFLNDLAKYIPGVIGAQAQAALSNLIIETEKLTSKLSTRKAQRESELAKLTARWDMAVKTQADCNIALTRAKTRMDEREKYAQICCKQHEDAQTLFVSSLGTNGFKGKATYVSSLISEATLASMVKQLANYDERGRQIRRDLDRLEKDTAGKEKPNLETLKCNFDRLKSNAEVLRAQRDEANLRLDNKQRIFTELKKSGDTLLQIEQEYAAVKSLSDTANGKLDFETYAQMTYFERVLRAANLRLKVMSQNRYMLLRKEESGDGRKRMGLEIEVADSNTGKSRSANSLSGGESFMASLSLALGLSDVVQQSTGGIHLDAMFIDEGFGSLDAEVLELSVRTLSDMAGVNRIIGIISHVADLRDRIEKQIHVEKTHGGSKIRLVI